MTSPTLRRATPSAALLFLLTLTPWGGGALTAQEEIRLSGDEVGIHNLAGMVRLVPGSGSETVVRLTRGGDAGGDLRIETGQVRGRSTLRVIYPDDELVYPAMGRRSRTTTRVTSDGFLGEGGESVTVRGSGRGTEAWADLVVEIPAGVDTELRLAVGEVEADGVDGTLLVDTGSGEVRTRNTSGRLTVDTGSGEISVRGASGPVFLDTGSGSIQVEGVRGEVLEVDTGSGGVQGSDLRTDEVLVDTGSGSIRLASVTARFVHLDTGSGSVELSLDGDVESLEVDTGSGSITVEAPEDLGAEIELDTGSGGIDVDFPVQVRSASRDHMEGTLGDGQGEIRIDTGSGSIRLRRVRR